MSLKHYEKDIRLRLQEQFGMSEGLNFYDVQL